jgi:hypothetical protein
MRSQYPHKFINRSCGMTDGKDAGSFHIYTYCMRKAAWAQVKLTFTPNALVIRARDDAL